MRSPSTRNVVVPRCKTCDGRFPPKSRVSCIECDADIHYDCAVYEDDDSHYMLCLDCFKNKKIEKGLERDGIIVKVEGDDMCRAYIGKSFWLKDDKQKIKIEDMDIECVYDRDLEKEKEPDCAYGYCREDLYNRGKLPNWREMYICERCKDDLYYLEKLADDACPYCGWRCEYEQSHTQYGNTGCKYINEKYDIEIDEDGEIIATEKSLEPFESSDFVVRLERLERYVGLPK